MIIPILLVLIVGMALALIVVGVRMPAKEVTIEERLATFAERPIPLEQLELQRPFSDRVIKPLLVGWARKLARFTPRQNAERLRISLLEAGSPSGIGVVEFMGLRAVMLVLLGGSALFLTVFTGASFKPINLQLVKIPGILLFPGPLAMLGYTIPGIWLNQRIRKRKKDILRSLPDAIDLLTISVEAGLGFDAALQQVARNTTGPVAEEFSRVLREMQLGMGRADALKAMGGRSNVEDLNTFVGSMVQADAFGIPIGQVLRVQSNEIRVKRRQYAEEKAQKVPVKIMVPLILFILPCLFIVVMGPAVLNAVDAFNNK